MIADLVDLLEFAHNFLSEVVGFIAQVQFQVSDTSVEVVAEEAVGSVKGLGNLGVGVKVLQGHISPGIGFGHLLGGKESSEHLFGQIEGLHFRVICQEVLCDFLLAFGKPFIGFQQHPTGVISVLTVTLGIVCLSVRSQIGTKVTTEGLEDMKHTILMSSIRVEDPDGLGIHLQIGDHHPNRFSIYGKHLGMSQQTVSIPTLLSRDPQGGAIGLGRYMNRSFLRVRRLRMAPTGCLHVVANDFTG